MQNHKSYRRNHVVLVLKINTRITLKRTGPALLYAQVAVAYRSSSYFENACNLFVMNVSNVSLYRRDTTSSRTMFTQFMSASTLQT